ncbi:Yip1 domain protein [Roseovarius litorisediminis]|uniref:Yip1 domain protein n=1 Tax=Roseovarius litorisediminis TaxID=1312363 RepID=A0A1Y5RFB0_9RHOB|nr:Yip1 family protein [Roseovarius litorisediminis]SLN13511.1 Yip1 domain protein [Roseovarius litorisediminis]
MTPPDFKALLVQSLLTPKDAARQLIAFNLSRRWLWMALALMTVLNAIVYSVSIRLSPPVAGTDGVAFVPLFHSPFLFTMLLFGALVITVFTLQWIGQRIGGKARLGDILVLLTWMQVLRLLLQIGVAVLMLLAPMLAVLLVLISSFWGIYILVNFVDAAHQFDSKLKSVGVIILAVFAIAVGMAIILTTIGLAVMGAS